MMGTYPLLQSQYTTAKREIQGVFNKISNNSACIKRRFPTVQKNLKYSGQGEPPPTTTAAAEAAEQTERREC